MKNVSVSDKSVLERVKIFSGLILVSVVVVIAASIAIKIHCDNIKIKGEIQEQNTKIKQENAKLMDAIKMHSNNEYRIRNELQEIALTKTKGKLKEDLLNLFMKLGQESNEKQKSIKQIINNLEKLTSATEVPHLSLISTAYANDGSVNNSTLKNSWLLCALLAILTLLLIGAVVLLLVSNDDRKISFSIDLIKMIASCIIGALSGAAGSFV